jgi:hypothetical protein
VAEALNHNCIFATKSRFAKAKAAFSNKQILFTNKLDLNLTKKLIKCYIWSTDLYGAEDWALREVHQKSMEKSEMWCWRRMEITCTVKSEEVLHTV